MLWSLRTNIAETGKWHNHDFYEFLICLKTGGRLETEVSSFDFCEGKTILVSPGVKHRFTVQEPEEVDVKLICISESNDSRNISPASVATLYQSRDLPVSVADLSENDSTIKHILSLVPDDFKRENAKDQAIAWSAVNLLLAIHHKEAVSPDKKIACKYKKRISEICAWINDNISSVINIDDIALNYGMCRSLLTREFRCYTGQSIIEYANCRKTELAAKFLVTGDYSVNAISSMTGFANLSHFHRQFKKQYGMTPAAFRKKIRGN